MGPMHVQVQHDAQVPQGPVSSHWLCAIRATHCLNQGKMGSHSVRGTVRTYSNGGSD